jgi:hypothetical protein
MSALVWSVFPEKKGQFVCAQRRAATKAAERVADS